MLSFPSTKDHGKVRAHSGFGARTPRPAAKLLERFKPRDGEEPVDETRALLELGELPPRHDARFLERVVHVFPGRQQGPQEGAQTAFARHKLADKRFVALIGRVGWRSAVGIHERQKTSGYSR